MSRKAWLLGLALWVVHHCGVAATAQQPPTLDQVIDGLQQCEKLFFESQSFLVRYERTKSEDLVPNVATGGLLLAEWTLGYQGDKWLNQRRFTQPSSTGKFLIPAEPKRVIAKSGFVCEWDGGNTTAYLCSIENAMNVYYGLYFTGNLSLDAPKYIARAGRIPGDLPQIRKKYGDDADRPFLPEFLRANKARYRVLPEPETIEGVRCWVVEWPGMDRFCVSVERGFSVPKRRHAWGPGKPMQFEFRNSDYREVKPGLWMPFTQVVDIYASIVAEREAIWGKVVCRAEYRVHALQFDDVPESVFETNFPAGTRVYDNVRDFHYVVTDKNVSDPFAAPVAQARALLERSRLRITIAVATCVVVLLGVALFLWRRVRTKT